MKLGRAEVQHIAELAKLGLTDQEATQYGEQLSAILAYFELLNELDTSSIPPTAMVTEQANVLRDDCAAGSLPIETALRAARSQDCYIAVKAILD